MRLMEMGQSASSAQDMVTLTRLCLASARLLRLGAVSATMILRGRESCCDSSSTTSWRTTLFCRILRFRQGEPCIIQGFSRLQGSREAPVSAYIVDIGFGEVAGTPAGPAIEALGFQFLFCRISGL